jgi:hypothetical protein
MCPEGTTTAGDGSSECNVTLTAAVNTQLRYAVVVYFSVNVNASDLAAMALRAGAAAPAYTIVSSLLRSDTATAFNISEGDVNVMSIRQVERRTLQANVSATMGVDAPDGASAEEAAAALEVQRLSADNPIELLSNDPAAFFGRTTKTLDVGVTANAASAVEVQPNIDPLVNTWALIGPGIVVAVGGASLVGAGCWKSRRARKAAGRYSRFLHSHVAP